MHEMRHPCRDSKMPPRKPDHNFWKSPLKEDTERKRKTKKFSKEKFVVVYMNQSSSTGGRRMYNTAPVTMRVGSGYLKDGDR